MAPIAAIAIKETQSQKCGIKLINHYEGAPVTISDISPDGLFASTGLLVGMQVLTINNQSMDGKTSSDAVQLLKDAVGQVILVADNPLQQAAVIETSSATTAAMTTLSMASSSSHHPNHYYGIQGKKYGYIILKKTFKYKPSGFQMSTEKSYSFHGPVTDDMINRVNSTLSTLRLVQGANLLQFKMDNYGHFHGAMNHQAQKYHEEDFVVVILEAMERLGWYFRFQYDAEAFSTKLTGDSYTAKELFIFHRMQE